MSYWPGDKKPEPFDLVLFALGLCLIMFGVMEIAYMTCGTVIK